MNKNPERTMNAMNLIEVGDLRPLRKKISRMKKISGCLFFMFFLMPVAGQQENDGEPSIMEQETDPEASGIETWAEELSYYRMHPLNINTASEDDFRRLHLLNDFQIRSLLDYRQQNGFFQSVYECKLLYGWDSITLCQVRPFLIAGEPSLSRRLQSGQGHHCFLSRFRFHPPGDSAWFTSRTFILGRYTYDLDNVLHASWVTEKDYGETAFSRDNPVMDYTSASLVVNHMGGFRTLAAGDYHACFGQGLALWTGFGFGKPSSPMMIVKNGEGFSRYSSTDENKALRGTAVAFSLKDFSLSLFYSRRPLDACIYYDSLTKKMFFSSFQTTGLHRTEAEIKNEKSVPAEMKGIALQYANEWLSTGLLLNGTRFGYDYVPSAALENALRFTGNHSLTLSHSYRLFLHQTEWFGETAVLNNHSFAFLHGMIVNLSPALSFSALYRRFSEGYYALYTCCFRENSRTENEQGLYYGIQFTPLRQLKMNAWIDFFSHPWLKYHVCRPSYGREWMIDFTWLINESMTFYGRIKQKTDMEDMREESNAVACPAATRRTTFRNQLSCRISPETEWRTRMELCRTGTAYKQEKGYYLHQEMIWTPRKKISVWIRYTVFHTDGYESRIYAYENNFAYAFSMPAFYGEGSRLGIMIQWSFKQWRIGMRHNFFLSSQAVSSGRFPETGIQIIKEW